VQNQKKQPRGELLFFCMSAYLLSIWFDGLENDET